MIKKYIIALKTYNIKDKVKIEKSLHSMPWKENISCCFSAEGICLPRPPMLKDLYHYVMKPQAIAMQRSPLINSICSESHDFNAKRAAYSFWWEKSLLILLMICSCLITRVLNTENACLHLRNVSIMGWENAHIHKHAGVYFHPTRKPNMITSCTVNI